MTQNIETRLAELGIKLPVVPTPTANYSLFRRVGNLLFLAGHGPVEENGFLHTGKVGAEISEQQAYQCARLTACNMLATVKHAIGDLNKVRQVVKLLGMVQCSADFLRHPEVINGCSDLFVDIFGREIGCGARSAVGFIALPYGQTVEIEAIFEVACD